MTKTKICGPQRIGASAMDEGDLTRAVVASYSALTQDEAREGGQAAAEQILPARRRLWALTERLLPKRLAAALRARCGTDDPTARDGVRELRRALADWLDPPPVCRWCRAWIREDGQVCRAIRGQRAPRVAVSERQGRLVIGAIVEPYARESPARSRAWTPRERHCRPAKNTPQNAVARCGTLALYSAGQVSLEVMAAALAVPKGAAKGYDVACDRDAKALTVATSDGPPPGRDLDDPADWQDEALRRMYAAVAGLGGDGGGPVLHDLGALADAGRQNLADRPRALGQDEKVGAAIPPDHAALAVADIAQGPHNRLARRGLEDAEGLHAELGADGEEGGLGGGGVRGVHGQNYAPLHAPCQAGMRQRLNISHGTAIPPQIAAAREEWRRLRGEAVAANGRAVLGIQTRYYAPRDGVCRADLVQGAAIGADRGLADYDATQSRYTTYGADWMRQGCGEAWGDRDLVGTPEWVHALRVKLEDSLPGVTRADVLRAVEALADSVAADAPESVRAKARARAVDLARLVIPVAEVRENVLGSRNPVRYVRRPLFSDHSEDAIEAHAASALKAAIGKAKGKSAGDEDPERVRERVCDWLSKRLRLKKASGPGLLAALRHGAPVFVQIGSGGDEEDEATQGGAGDGGGGSERMAAVLAAPDESDSLAEEEVARMRWQAALAALSALQASGGKEAAEVVRRHHGLDSIAEDRNGATGESFASIAASGLASTGRTLTKEGVRKIYNRGIAVLQDHIAGKTQAGDLAALFESSATDDADDFGPVRVPRSPWKPVGPGIIVTAAVPPSATRPIVDGRAWEDFRATADAVAW